jgi:lysyl-tRNA synthetase class II
LSSCATIKTEHHITLDHNIKVEINLEGRDALDFFDELNDPIARYNRSNQREQKRLVQDAVDMYIDYLYADAE